jgi:putative tricarboxylic transport membrane protein
MRTRLRDMWLTAQDWADSRIAILRGSLIGFVIGVMPGAGPTIASMLAYVAEKRFSRHPERFGRGAIDGVAAPESANNAASHGACVPMLALGIPGSASTAVLLAALILHGIRPGPGLMTEQSTLVWALIASMFIGNVILLVLNLPLAPLFAALLRVRYAYLAPGILAISLVGAYANTLDFAQVWIALAFGVVGWFMLKLDFPRAPLVLALVLAPLLESSLRQSLLLSFGSVAIFVERPLSAALLACVVVSLLLPAAGAFRRRAVRNAG